MRAMIAPRNASSDTSLPVEGCCFNAAEFADFACAVAIRDPPSTLLHSDMKMPCCLAQPAVERIELTLAEPGSSQQVHVDPTESKAMQTVRLDKFHHLFMLRRWSGRQLLQILERYRPVMQRPAGELAQNERVGYDPAFVEQSLQRSIAAPKELDPSRGVGQNHFAVDRLRGMRSRRGLGSPSAGQPRGPSPPFGKLWAGRRRAGF